MRRARILAAALWLAVSGCITTPLEDRGWLAVRTAHYDIWSSLGEEETRQLSVAVERFRAATEYLWGRGIAPPPVRTRIYAFDDRGIGRPFAYGPERSFLLPRTDGDILVLRTGAGWVGDARTALRLAVARRLIASSGDDREPPWLREGVAQLASTLEIRGPGASIGIPQEEHLRSLRNDQWISFDRLLAADDMPSWSDRERALFEAESWALLHTLRLSDARRTKATAQIARLREMIAEGASYREAADTAFGQGLRREVWQHIDAEMLPSVLIRIQREGEAPSLRRVPRREILEQLGSVAVAIEAVGPAARYLEEAREDPPVSARVLADLSALRGLEGDRVAEEALLRAALAADPKAPRIHIQAADRLRRLAGDTTDPGRRDAFLARARAHDRQAIALAPDLPAAHAGLAASHLLPGQDPAAGLAHARRAQALLPGDPALRLLGARLSLAAGDLDAAREDALRLIQTAGSPEELGKARSFQEEIESRVTTP